MLHLLATTRRTRRLLARMDQLGGIELVMLYICVGWAALIWLLALALPTMQTRRARQLREEANARERERAREVAHWQQEVHPSHGAGRLAPRLRREPRKPSPAPGREEVLIHGVRDAFPAVRGEVTRGMATPYAAPTPERRVLRRLDASVQAAPDRPDQRSQGSSRCTGRHPKPPCEPEFLCEVRRVALTPWRWAGSRERRLAAEAAQRLLRADSRQPPGTNCFAGAARHVRVSAGADPGGRFRARRRVIAPRSAMRPAVEP